MQDLIGKDKFAQAIKLPQHTKAAETIMGMMGIHKINELYKKISKHNGLEFIDRLMEELDIKIEFDPKELENIPEQGAFISVSNHPFGAIEGLILLSVLGKKRPDYKLVANFLLQQIQPIKDHFISVNPFENRKDAYSSIPGIKATLRQLSEGNSVGIFPAGEVSSFNFNDRCNTDKRWQRPTLKLIQKAEVPVIPIYFKGSNSMWFQLLGAVHPSLRTLSLPSELLKKKNKTIQLRIGKAITVKTQKQFFDADHLGRYLRAKTYALGNPLQIKAFYDSKLKPAKKEIAIASPVNHDAILREIEENQSQILLRKNQFEIFLCKAEKIPMILKEMGRLREISFRKIGEGSLKKRDLDEYDLYYKHLFLWDNKAEKIVGSYRLGIGKDILHEYGKKGFYTNSLFHMKKEFKNVLGKSVELGRSFISEEYQKQRLPLFLLWSGLIHYALTNPNIRYFIGPVSISNSYSKLSKELIVAFIRKNHSLAEMTSMIRPRKKYRTNLKNVDVDTLIQTTGEDFKKLDRLIEDIEISGATVPILIKKYVRENAKIIAFNIDPKFNRALDGFMVLDLHELSETTKQNLTKEFNDIH